MYFHFYLEAISTWWYFLIFSQEIQRYHFGKSLFCTNILLFLTAFWSSEAIAAEQCHRHEGEHYYKMGLCNWWSVPVLVLHDTCCTSHIVRLLKGRWCLLMRKFPLNRENSFIIFEVAHTFSQKLSLEELKASLMYKELCFKEVPQRRISWIILKCFSCTVFYNLTSASEILTIRASI